MIHVASIVFWTDVPRGRKFRPTCVDACCSFCKLAVTVKVTPKKCHRPTWMSVVAVTSRQMSKCLAEQSRSRHINVHDMTRNHS